MQGGGEDTNKQATSKSKQTVNVACWYTIIK